MHSIKEKEWMAEQLETALQGRSFVVKSTTPSISLAALQSVIQNAHYLTNVQKEQLLKELNNTLCTQ